MIIHFNYALCVRFLGRLQKLCEVFIESKTRRTNPTVIRAIEAEWLEFTEQYTISDYFKKKTKNKNGARLLNSFLNKDSSPISKQKVSFFCFAHQQTLLDSMHFDSIKLYGDWVANCPSLCSSAVPRLFRLFITALIGMGPGVESESVQQ